ncbi:RNA-directed DNA polymerase [candidate division KSB1 bacterium]|nr:RNA-directed DNA polymerase [candidate division KSB1 bacterium]
MLEILVDKLFEYFVGNEDVYAEQISSGYNTIYRPITKETIIRMIREKQSFLSYQFIGENVKWICFDFDIKKSFYESSIYKSNHAQYHISLLNIVKNFCENLKNIGINNLIEFSGNRGFHVWIILNKPIKGYLARQILEKIKDISNFNIDDSIFAMDEFPKSSYKNGKIGFGVKLPLSLHKKSGYYSFLFNSSNIDKSFNFNVETLSQNFLHNQFQILNSYVINKSENLLSVLNIELRQEQEEEINSYLKTRKPTLNEKLDLEKILEDLEKCNVLKPIIQKYFNASKNDIQSNLNEKERLFFVGLLIRLRIKNDRYYGKKLLKELFSKLPNFKENLTEKKLNRLNLYPLTCQYFRAEFSELNCPCDLKKNNFVFKTPIELITSIDTETLTEEIFEIWEEDINQILKSQINYIKYNDEVDLAFQIEELEQLNPKLFIKRFLYHRDNQKEIDSYYVFKRKEENKERYLVSLSTADKILTTVFIKILNSLFYTEWSTNSYGYKFCNNFADNQIFEPWLKQWNIYIKGLEKIIFNPDFKNYHVIKLDIKSFYSEIDLDRLERKLLDGTTNGLKQKLKGLDELSRKRYFIICKTLISYCKSISNKGVPQGPAFARYLAEVYLIQLDQFIEKNIENSERYFRYVDDIFIFLNRDIQRTTSFCNEIISFIQTHNLSINQKDNKFYLGNIRNYQNEFYEYKDKTKYFIDYNYKNQKVISLNMKNKAIQAMFSLLKTGQNGEAKNENLNFFFTHFENSLLVNEKKGELEKYMLKLNIGRGSLFRNFYNYYFELIQKGNTKLHNEIYGLSGLNRIAFLNACLKCISKQTLSNAIQLELKKIIDTYADENLENCEKEILFHIMFKDNVYINEKYFTNENTDIIIKVINTELKKNIPNSIILFLFENIEQISLLERIRLIYRVIFFNNIVEDVIAKLKNAFITSILEEIGSNQADKFTLSIFKNINKNDELEIAYQFYQLLCLFSITKDSTWSDSLPAIIKHIWTNFLFYINCNNPIFSANSLSWVKLIDKIDLNISIINVVIASKVDDNFVDIKAIYPKLYEDFYDGVLYSFYFKNKDKKNLSAVLSQTAKSVIEDLIRKENLVFLEWLQNDNTSLYPDKKTCIQNIIQNERLVLKQGGAPHC